MITEPHAHAEQDEGQWHVRLSLSSLMESKNCYKNHVGFNFSLVFSTIDKAVVY